MKLSKNNIQSKLQKEAHQIPHFSIRKLTIGAASVLLSTSLYLNWNNLNALAAENSSTKHGTYDVNKKQENPPAANESLKTTNKMVDKKLVNQKVNQTDAELKAHIATAENLNSDKITPKTNQQLDLAIATAKTAIQSYSEDAKKDTAHRLKTVVLQAKKEAAEKTKKESVKSVSVDNLKALSDQLFDKTMHLDQTKADKGDVQKIIDFGIELDGFLKNKNLKAEQLNNYETNAKRMLALVDKLPKIQINAHGKSMPQSRSYADRDGEDRDFDLKNLSLHKPLSAKEFNSDQFKLQQEKNSAIAFLQYALSWNNNPQNTVVDETAGGNKVKDEEIKENAILGINVANNREQIRQWLDYVFWHKRGMFIVPQSPDGNTTGNDVFALYKPGTFLYGTHNNAKEIPTVKEIHNTVYVKNSLIKDQTGKLVGYHWTVEFNHQHADRKSGHYYFTTPKGQSIVSSNDSKNGVKFADAAIVSTDASGHSKTLTGRGYTVDNIWQNATQNDFLPADRVSGTAQGPETYYGKQSWKTYTRNGVNLWWGGGSFSRWNYIGSAHTLKDIIYKHYWQGSNYPQSGCTKLNKDEWGDEAQFTNSRDGIKMGPFIDNLYKYKYDFNKGESSDYQRIDYAQLIQENTDRVYMFESKQDDTNTYKITFDTRIDDPKSTNVHNPYYAAGYLSYENKTTVNYMQWGGLRFKPELSITINGKKNNILVDPQTHNDYVEVHEGEKTKISLNSKNDKQGLAMWSTDYKSTSALSWQLGKADENLFNADYKETPVDADNNAANPYVHQNARMELSGVVIAKPGSEMNIAWAGSGMPNFTADDITNIYGNKTQMDDGLNAFLPNREIRSVNVRVIPAAAYAQKTKIAIRFNGQQIVLSEQEKQAIKKTIYAANKDHYDIKNGENGITVDNSGNVSFTIQFNAAKHKGDRANMQYRKLTLKPADTLSYTTIDIKPVDGSASFSLNSKNGAIDPTLTVYNHEPYQVKVNATDTTSKMNDFLTNGGTNVTGLSTDHQEYQKNHRGMHVDDKKPYVLTMNGQGLSKDGKTYKIKFESWDGNDTKTVSQEVKVVVADQAGRYQNKVKGRTWTVEVNDNVVLSPTDFVDAKTQALLKKAANDVKYTWTTSDGKQPANNTVSTKTNGKYQPSDVKIIAKFSDGSTKTITGHLIVQDTKAPTVKFEETPNVQGNKIAIGTETSNNQKSVTITTYRNEKFSFDVKANDNSKLVSDVKLTGTTLEGTSTDHDSKKDHGTDPYTLTIFGSFTPTTKTGQYTRTIQATDKAGNSSNTSFKFYVKEQAAQFDGQTLTGQTQTVTLHTKINQNEVERYVSDATKSLLKKANGDVTYSFKDMKELSTDAVSADGKQVHVIATFSDKSTKEIIGTLIVNDKNAPTVNFVKGTNSGPVQIDNQSKTITVYRNEKFNINANVKDDSKVVKDAKLISKDAATHTEFTITTDHDSNHNHGHDPYVLNISGSFGTQAKLGSYSRTIHAVDGNNNSGDTNFKFVVKEQAAQFDGDQLNGATKTVEVNSGYTPKAEDFIDKATKQKLDAANGTENYAFEKQPTIDKVKTETVPITVTFSDGSHKVINGTLKVQDTTVPSLKLIKTNSNKKNRVGEITCTPSDSKHKNSTATVVVYRNEQFSIQALATDNSNIINDARFHGSAADITDNHDVYQAQYRGKKGKVNDPYVVTIEGSFSKDLKFDPNTHTKTIDGAYVRAWDGVDNTNDLKIKFIVKDQSAQFDNDKLNGITKIVEINSANIPQAQDFIDPATLKKLSSAKDGITCSFANGKEPKIDTVKTNEKVDVVVTFSDKSTKTIRGHLTVKDTTAPVITVAKSEKGKCVVNGDQITVYNNEPFNLNVSAVDNSNHVSNITIEGTHEGVSLASDHKGEGSKAKPYTAVISGTFNDKGTHTITLNATDASHNKGTKKLTVVVKGQDAQFDNQTLTGITKTVEVNDDSVSLNPEDFVSQDTKNLLGKATKGVKWTFVDNKELDKSKVTSANTGKEVHIKAEFADKTSKTIVGHLIVQDTKAPTLELVSSDPKSKDIVVTKGSDNSYNITVYRGREFKLLAKATDNSHVVTDVNIAGGDINGFSNDHDTYIKNLAKNPKGTSKDPYVLTMTGTFANDFSTGLYERTVTAKDASGHSTTITMKITLKSQNERFKDEFHGYKVLVPEQLDWQQIFKAENQPVPPKDFVAIPADAPDNLSYKFECDDSGNPCIYVDFADKSSLKLSLETITADAQNKNRVAETIQRNIIIKKDGQSTTSVQKAEFIRYIILKSEGISKISSIALDKDLRSASISDEYGQWLTKSKSNDNVVTYSDNAELSKYDAKNIVGYQKVETANDTLEVKPNSNDSINKYLIEKTDENDFSPAKKIPDIVIEYKRLADVITNDGHHEKPAGYVTVTFSAGEHGELSGTTSYYVNPEATQVELKAPTVKAKTGYKFSKWNHELSGQFKSDTTITAQYEQLDNVITNDGHHEKPIDNISNNNTIGNDLMNNTSDLNNEVTESSTANKQKDLSATEKKTNSKITKRLPQTGEKENSVLGLLIIGLSGLLGIIDRKKRKDK